MSELRKNLLRVNHSSETMDVGLSGAGFCPLEIRVLPEQTRLLLHGGSHTVGGLLHFFVNQDGLCFEILEDGLHAQVNGTTRSSGPLELNDELVFQGQRFQVVPSLLPVTLQGLNEPHRGRLWLLGSQEKTLLGRGGRRSNHVILEDLTVSRMHAYLEPRDGDYFLVAETSSSPTRVNGNPVRPNLPIQLKDGDLVRLGNSLLAFYQPRSGPEELAPVQSLRIYSLGNFEVQLGGVRTSGARWRGPLSRFLLAYLAAEWPGSVSVERLLDLFWPEMDPERARNNLRTTLTNLRSQLQIPAHGRFLERTSQTIQFDSQLVVWHDLNELRSALKSAQGTSGTERRHFLARALELYRGKYLEDCYMEFAVSTREAVERQLVGGALELLANSREARDHSGVVDYGQQVIALDPSSQEAYQWMMEAYRALGRPQEAVRLYETCKRALVRELDTEPALEIEREYQMARMEMR